MKKSWVSKLEALGACREAVEWAQTQRSSRAAWANCHRGDWMLWYLGRTAKTRRERRRLVRAACACARLALVHTSDSRVLRCIEVAESWSRGRATLADVRAAAYAAASAAAAAYAADDAASAAAAAASAASAAYAASASAAAAASAASAAYAAYARHAKLRECSDIVRKVVA